MSELSRRNFLQGAAAAPLALDVIRTLTPTSASFLDIHRPPDLVRAFGPLQEEIELARTGERWSGGRSEVHLVVRPDRLELRLQGEGASWIQLRWNGDCRGIHRYLGDHWERSYGDLEWRGESPNRPMPWYFMAFDGHTTHGYGVGTGAGAMCFWTADSEGISLWADVRSGGQPVLLGERSLHVADILCRRGIEGESAFDATQAFCRQMCPNPRLPKQPVYGTNDWNYAYGNNSAGLIASVSDLISELSPNQQNRPFSVIDEGWAMGPFENNFGHGPWEGNPRFGDMASFGARLKGLGVRPGIWFRPLTPLPDTPRTWSLSRDARFLDPTVPEVKNHVAQEIRKLVGWGYELIKHDFTTWDLMGAWGFEMGSSPTAGTWRLHDGSKTNAEVLTDLYRTIREAAGEALLLGCNTVGHLAVGFHELQRTGDDTSGRSWNRNRRMGVNTLAFRAPQQGAFFQVDPDIVAITKAVPWSLVEQWLHLVSQSGTSLFVAVEPQVVEPKHRTALKTAFETAAKHQRVAEPLDWMDTVCPRRWRLRGKEVEFAWMGASGAWPFPD